MRNKSLARVRDVHKRKLYIIGARFSFMLVTVIIFSFLYYEEA